MKSIPCDEALELLSASLDGALSAEEEAALEAHLAGCPACGALLADLAEIHAALDGAQAVPPPADLKDRIMAAVAAEQVVPFPAPAKRRPRWRAWAPVAAVLALALLGGGLLHTGAGGGANSAAPMAAGGAAPRSAYSVQAPAGAPASGAEDSAIPEAAAQAAEPAEGLEGVDAGDGAPMEDNDTARAPDAPVPAPFRTTPAAGEALTADTLPDAVCGILTLPAAEAPALDGCFSVEAEDGLHCYLPAADFQALAGAFADRKGAALTAGGGEIDPEAAYGLVILTP